MNNSISSNSPPPWNSAAGLDYYRHYQKTALDDELKRMEQLSKENDLGDLSVIAPILQTVADDASLMHVVRTRAQRLLAVPVK